MQNIRKSLIEIPGKYLLLGWVIAALLLYSSCKQIEPENSSETNKSAPCDACCKSKVDSMIQNPQDHPLLDFENLSHECQMKFLKQAQDTLKVMDTTSLHFAALSALVYDAGYFILKQQYISIWLKAHNGTSVFYDNSPGSGLSLISGLDAKVKVSVLIDYWVQYRNLYKSTHSGNAPPDSGIICYPVLNPQLVNGQKTIAIMIAATDAVNISSGTALTMSQYFILKNPFPYNNNLAGSASPPAISPFNSTIGSPVIPDPDNPRTYRLYKWKKIIEYINANINAADYSNTHIGFELGYIDADMQTQIWDVDGSGTILGVPPFEYERKNLIGITTLLPLYNQQGQLIFNPSAQLPRIAGGAGAGYIMEIGKPCPPYCSK